MTKFINKKKHKLLSLKAIRLLRKVQKQLRVRPQSYNQQLPFVPKDECGSPSCICGWMGYFAGEGSNLHSVVGLTHVQWCNLFFSTCWPRKFYKPGSGARNIKPSTAIRRIEHFIQTDGQE